MILVKKVTTAKPLECCYQLWCIISLVFCLQLFSCISGTGCKLSWAVKQLSLLYSFSGRGALGSRHWGWGALVLPTQINNFLNGDFKYIGVSSNIMAFQTLWDDHL